MLFLGMGDTEDEVEDGTEYPYPQNGTAEAIYALLREQLRRKEKEC